MTTYEVIERLCNEHGIAITALEKELGFGRGYIGKFKTKGTIPSAKKLQQIADYFKVTMGYLMDDNAKQEMNVLMPPKAELQILLFYNKLNPNGQAEATKRVYELTQIKEYTNVATETAEKIISYNDIVQMDIPMAAHENEGATMEMKEEDLNNALKLVQKDRT